MFVNNTTLYLLSYCENLDRTFKVLDLYHSTSRTKHNGYKIRCIWASSSLRNFIWRIKLGIQWLEDEEAIKYISKPPSFKISQDTKDEATLVFVNKHLTF